MRDYKKADRLTAGKKVVAGGEVHAVQFVACECLSSNPRKIRYRAQLGATGTARRSIVTIPASELQSSDLLDHDGRQQHVVTVSRTPDRSCVAVALDGGDTLYLEVDRVMVATVWVPRVG